MTNMKPSEQIAFEPVDAVIGARVTGISLTTTPDQDTIAVIEQALEKYGVLIFPEQQITPQQQVDFSAAFAPLELTELEKARLTGVEEIFVVGNVGAGLVSFAPQTEDQELEWHTDHIHRPTPARASLLYAKEVPEQGGDTLFACMYQAFDALSEAEQKAYCKIQTINSSSGLERYLAQQNLDKTNSSGSGRRHDQVIWPLVRAHPLTGRKALYFANQVTIGLVGENEAESLSFVAALTRHACQAAFRYRHRWSVGDAVLWDNRRVLHAGLPYDVVNSRRLMHRTTWRETESIELTQ
jgi:taurine dioxygenase